MACACEELGLRNDPTQQVLPHQNGPKFTHWVPKWHQSRRSSLQSCSRWREIIKCIPAIFSRVYINELSRQVGDSEPDLPRMLDTSHAPKAPEQWAGRLPPQPSLRPARPPGRAALALLASAPDRSQLSRAWYSQLACLC